MGRGWERWVVSLKVRVKEWRVGSDMLLSVQPVMCPIVETDGTLPVP